MAMSSTPLSATLDFLTDAAHLLATSAPETSAYLMNRRNNIMLNNELPQTDVQRQHVCGCCGQIMMLADGTALELKSVAKKKKKISRRSKSARLESGGQQPQNSMGTSKVITCGRCGKFTSIKFPPPAPISRQARIRKAMQPETPASVHRIGQDTQERKPSANASSKKRAKSRKGGLQTLLAEHAQKSRQQSGLGLSLSDFMKK